MEYFAAFLVILVVAIVVLILLFMVASVVLLAAIATAATWLVCKLLPRATTLRFVRRLSPVETLTDRYVHGHIDIDEFERQLGGVLSHS